MYRPIEDLLQRSHGVIVRRDHPALVPSLDRAVGRGELVPLLPGVYSTPAAAQQWQVRLRAAAQWDPRAVVLGQAAAALTFWPELVPDVVDIATQRRPTPRPGFTFTRRRISDDHVVVFAGIRVVAPALTALDLVDEFGGDAIDRALRSRTVTLRQMHRALADTRYRYGNVDRRRMLLDSRDQPWSAAERLAHRVLRSAGITGWRSNVPIVCDGHCFYLDIAFDCCPLVLEIDGRTVHGGAEAFEDDRWRGNLIALNGRCVLRFTWRMLVERPEWVVDTVRRALVMLGGSS